MGNGNEIFRKTTGLEFVKQAARMSSRLWEVRNWTLWRGKSEVWEHQPLRIIIPHH
jgi:hypothetical protein